MLKGMLRWLFVCVAFSTAVVLGQEAKTSSEDGVLSKEQWKDLSEDLSYPTAEEPEIPEFDPPNISFMDSIPNLKYYLLAVILLALVYVLYIIVKNSAPANRAIKESFDFSELKDDDNIHETDLNKLLTAAEGQEQYNLAIRIRFLMLIKRLSELGLIDWKPGKTNRSYVREMKKHSDATLFVQLTRMYERIWFGDNILPAQLYQQVYPKYEQFHKSLSRGEEK